MGTTPCHVVGHRSLPHRLLLGLVALLLAAGWSVSMPLAAHADDDEVPSSWNVSKYHVVATPDKDGGRTRVVIDLDFDFGRDKGHGPFIVLPTRMGSPDPDAWRMLDTRIESVTSATGARTDQMVKDEDGTLLLRIGKKGTKFDGVQNYRITYTVQGILFPDHPESKMDEFNWNAVGPGWEVPLHNIKVTLNSPAVARKTACFWGRKYDMTCPSPGPDESMVWTKDRLDKGQGLQVVAGYPAGTFTNADFRTTKRYHMGNMFPLTPVNLGGAALVGAASVGGVLALGRRGRDQAYAGVIPGLAPAPGEQTRTTTRKKTPVAVAFRPPKGARPGEIGTLIDEKADMKDVTATMIDLAVRGHMRIEQIDKKNQRYTRLQGADELEHYEKKLMSAMFKGARSVTTKDLRNKNRGDMLSKCQADLYERVSTPPLQWFKSNPQTSRIVWFVLGVLVLLAGIGLSVAMGFAGLGLVPVGIAVAGLVLIILSPTMPARTPQGSAVLAEAKGFELYLTTAEAEQIKFEEGIDVFSRYLPYAIIFGVADRWVKIFEKLEREGRYQGDTSWYVGNVYGYGFANFSSTIDSITSSMESSMQASAQAAAAASGGSGFGGGGGAGGGGGGGW